MKSTKYTRFCRRLFSRLFEKFNISETSKNRLLEKADISMVYQEYYAMILFNIIIGFINFKEMYQECMELLNDYKNKI